MTTMTDDGNQDYHPEENKDPPPGNPMSKLQQELEAIFGAN